MELKPTPYRVLVVDDDGSLQSMVPVLFDTGELVRVGGSCGLASMADAVQTQRPDVVVLDLGEEPGAFQAIEMVMAENPTPILLLHSGRSSVNPFNALALGALDVAERPRHPPVQFWKELRRKVMLLAQVRVVRHVQGRRKRSEGRDAKSSVSSMPVVAIASSLGGPKALSVLLKMIPPQFHAPICICQHISDGFTTDLTQWLSSETSLKICEARADDVLEPGQVYIAPSRRHLMVQPNRRIKLDDGLPLMGFKPSCDALLTSVAQACGEQAIGVVLTGMGRDGARGLKEIHVRGGRTIAQNEATSIVFGMPKEAIALGAAQRILPLEGIAGALIEWVDRW